MTSSNSQNEPNISRFVNVLVAKESIIYFYDLVMSTSVIFLYDSGKSLGAILLGEYVFDADDKELMDKASGDLDVFCLISNG